MHIVLGNLGKHMSKKYFQNMILRKKYIRTQNCIPNALYRFTRISFPIFVTTYHRLNGSYKLEPALYVCPEITFELDFFQLDGSLID
jgi:hypothetical protein